MRECHLDYKKQDALGHKFYRVNNDMNGNPRYVIHWLAFGEDYAAAKKAANSIGFRVYRGKDFGGGFVGQSYALENTAESILDARAKQ